MSQPIDIKTKYSPSFPNLKHALFDRIQTLHQKNKAIALKSDNKNKEIVESHIHNKTTYQKTVMKIHKLKVSNAHQSIQQKKKDHIKLNQQLINKAHQNLVTIQSRNNNKIDKHMQQLSLKLQKAEYNRRKFTQLKKIQRLGTSNATPELTRLCSLQNRLDSSLDYSQVMNSTNISEQRKIIAQKRREELKRLQFEKSMYLLNQSLVKQQQALRRRNSLKSLSKPRILDEKIIQAQQHARKLQLERQGSYIFKTINKQSKLNTRLSEILARQDNVSGQKSKSSFKRQEKANNRRQDIQQIVNRKKQQLLQKKYAKIQAVSGKKQQMLQTFCQTLHQKVLQRKQRIQQKIEKMTKCERKRATNELKRQKQSMLFLTCLKAEKDRIISKNMYQNVQLRQLR